VTNLPPPPPPANIPEKRLAAYASAHNDTLNCSRLSPDGLRVATSTASHKLRVWDALKGAPLTDWLDPEIAVTNVWFTADSATVLTDTGLAWPLQVVSGPVPAWLPQVAEAVVGVRLNDQNQVEPVPASRFLEWQARLSGSAEPGRFGDWARQFFAGLSSKNPSTARP
jgi:hypothetical protein